MALPSQSARPVSRHAYMHRRSRRRRRWPFFATVAAALGLGASWWWWSGSFGDEAGDPTGAGSPEGLVTGVAALSSGERATAGPHAAAGPKDDEGVDRPPPLVNTAMPTPSLAAAAAAGSSTTTPRAVTGAGRRALRRMELGFDLLSQNQPLEARLVLTEALDSGALDDQDAASVRTKMAALAERIVFSPEIVANDPFAIQYTIQPNDALSRIPRKMGIQVDWRLVQFVNRLTDPTRIRPGQRIKLLTGPFHAVVHKHAFRLDLYLGDGPERVYVRSFPVGLGSAERSTPEGHFRIRPRSKLINPEWRSPVTHQRYLPDDPANPIGERWLGLIGDEPHLVGVVGYGIHGTIDPDSIGRPASMGCIRMLPEDIELVWAALMEGVSVVEIRP